MSKLTKTEVQALAEQITLDINKSNKRSSDELKREETLLKNKFYKTPLGKKILAIEKDEELLYLYTINNYRLNTKIGTDKIGNTSISISDVIRKIIIEQISCKDIDELIKKVNKSFNKK